MLKCLNEPKMGNCGWFSDNPIDTGKVYGLYGRIILI